ncbi:hypothetical protein [Herpetosiphon giganteus]|uniref:hypothetical protein n=1 Tax=Herpetosiphon giganteus TaxID=2029754 RepID=UPI0019598EC1|nr:hypothetical protein [Herpetosiphon giganteus]MBM7846194.1 hypothetical protein [Herpetosiphon giganteus]
MTTQALRKETFASYYKDLLLYLWNNGTPRTIIKSQIYQLVGASAYGNHNKLSLAPWALVENCDRNKARCLNQRGIEFIQGQLQIPLIIVRDETEIWRADTGTRLIHFQDVE